MSTDTAPDTLAPSVTPDRLTIRRIELIPVVVPLGREYRGSYYSMTHRASILTRIHTDEGVIGQAYAADEDATLKEIMEVVQALERQYDAFAEGAERGPLVEGSQQLPSADEIGAQFEQFLAEQGRTDSSDS